MKREMIYDELLQQLTDADLIFAGVSPEELAKIYDPPVSGADVVAAQDYLAAHSGTPGLRLLMTLNLFTETENVLMGRS